MRRSNRCGMSAVLFRDKLHRISQQLFYETLHTLAGRCELCSTRFRFAPRYAEGAPDRLPTREVCFRIFRRAGAKWLPFGIRALFAASLWLIVLPLSTSYIYHGWMHRPSAISKRWNWDLAKRDTVGGAVIAIIVVVSFLSLMSFAEFLRFQWNNGNGQQRGGGAAAAAAVGERQGNNNGRQRNGNGGIREGAGRAHAPNPSDDEIDDILERDCYEEYEIESDGDESEMSSSSPNPNNGPLERNAVGGMDPNGVLEIQEFLRSLGGNVGINERNNVDDSTNEDGQSDDRNNTDRADSSLHDDDHAQMNLSEVNQQLNYNNEAREERQGNDAIDDEDGQSDDDILFEHGDEDELEALVRAQEEQEIAQNQQIENDILEQEPLVPPQQEIRQNHRPRDDARFEPQFEPLQPAFAFEQDDQDDGVVSIILSYLPILIFRPMSYIAYFMLLVNAGYGDQCCIGRAFGVSRTPFRTYSQSSLAFGIQHCISLRFCIHAIYFWEISPFIGF